MIENALELFLILYRNRYGSFTRENIQMRDAVGGGFFIFENENIELTFSSCGDSLLRNYFMETNDWNVKYKHSMLRIPVNVVLCEFKGFKIIEFEIDNQEAFERDLIYLKMLLS